MMLKVRMILFILQNLVLFCEAAMCQPNQQNTNQGMMAAAPMMPSNSQPTSMHPMGPGGGMHPSQQMAPHSQVNFKSSFWLNCGQLCENIFIVDM
jgi:hypothetical protein